MTRVDSVATAAARPRRISPPARSTASASAATSRRGSIEWSPATSSASRTVGASAGSARRAWLGRSRSHLEPERAPERDQPVERLGLVGVARDDERARAAVARVAARGLRQLGAERLEGAAAAEPELEQRALAELRLGDRREHPGGDVPGPGLARVDDDGPQPALGGAPGARETDRPSAGDGDLVRLRCGH